MKRLIGLALILILGSAFVCCSENTPDNSQSLQQEKSPFAKDIPQSELRSVLAQKGVILLDVRTPEEFDAGHIEGAVNMNYYDDDFLEQVETLGKEKEILIYCRSGGRSSSAMSDMKSAGFKYMYNLEGGYMGYEKAE